MKFDVPYRISTHVNSGKFCSSTLSSFTTALVLSSALALAGAPLFAQGKAFIPVPLGNHVVVMDTSSGAVLARVAVGTDPIGVAIDATVGTVYITNHQSNTVSAIDMSTYQVFETITTGFLSPAGIAISPDGQTVYVANEGTNQANGSVVYFPAQAPPPNDMGAVPPTVTSIGEYSVPWGIIVGPNNGSLYVSQPYRGMVSRYNLKTRLIDGALDFTGPTAMTTSHFNCPPGGSMLGAGFREIESGSAACFPGQLVSVLWVVDSGLPNPPVGPPITGDQSVYEVNINGFKIIGTSIDGGTPDNIGQFPQTNTSLYVPNLNQSIEVLTPQSNGIGTTGIHTSTIPVAVAGLSGGNYLWVINNNNTVTELNPSSGLPVATFTIGLPQYGSNTQILGRFLTP